MKLILRKSKKTIAGYILVIFLFFLLLVYNYGNKKIKILGYAYENEKITIEFPYDKFYFTVSGNKEVGNLCFFNKETKYFQIFGNSKLSIRIDSSNVILLDTTFVLSKGNRKPILSFRDPSKTLFKRNFFIIDESDPRIIIP
jgi:hypothetical protein